MNDELEIYKTVIDLQLKQMEVVANYNYRMMEVAEKQIKVATDKTRLAVLQDAFKDFKESRIRALIEYKSIALRVGKYSDAITQAPWTLLGESIRPAQVGIGWRSLFFLIYSAPASTVSSVIQVPFTADLCQPYYFFSPREEEFDLDPSIQSVMHLMNWCRRADVVPKIGSPPQEKVAEVLTILSLSAEKELAEIQQKLDATLKEYNRIREKSWEEIDTQSVASM